MNAASVSGADPSRYTLGLGYGLCEWITSWQERPKSAVLEVQLRLNARSDGRSRLGWARDLTSVIVGESFSRWHTGSFRVHVHYTEASEWNLRSSLEGRLRRPTMFALWHIVRCASNA